MKISAWLRSVGLRFSLVFAIFSLLLVANPYSNSIASAIASNAPTVVNSYPGISNGNNAPPSGTIAANKREIIELSNGNYQMINSVTGTNVGTTNQLFGVSNGVFLSDPQIIWDNHTNRFYISMEANMSTTGVDNGIRWGFSKTANPTKASDFCTYFNDFNYVSSTFPDKQSLGDTTNFLMVGSERYTDSNEYIDGSDLAYMSKPPAGKACPAQSSFITGIDHLKNADGTDPFIPTPARQVDTSTTGWVTATPNYASSNYLSLFKVSDNASSLTLSPATDVTVPSYSNPPYAPQEGKTLSGVQAPPLETRIYLTQVIMAYDPRVGHNALWTAQTVAGGAGSEIRWYEINPGGLSLDQTGTISDPSLSLFNVTISPDRILNATATKGYYGSSAIINFNSSSATTYPAIWMESVTKGNQPSSKVLVKQSVGTDVDFTCLQPGATECRWGDYSGAVPDPNSPLRAANGLVLLVNQWNNPDINDSTPVWQTLIWRAQIN